MPFDINKVAQETKDFDINDFASEDKPFNMEDFVQPSYEGLKGTAEKFVRSHPIARALGMGPKDEQQPGIAQMAQDSSERMAEQASPLVKGIPVRQDFVNKTREDLINGGSVDTNPGVLQRTQEAVLNDTEHPKQMDALAGAIEKGPTKSEEQPVSNLLDTLVEGGKSTGRAVQAGTSLARGDLEKVKELGTEQQAAPRHPALEALMQDIQGRQAQNPNEDQSWASAAKEVAAAMAWNPDGAMHLIVEQTPNGLVPLATGAAGFFAGGVPGGIAGLFGGNVILSTGFRSLENADKEITDATRTDILKKGAIEGGVITGVDVATLGISNFILGAGRRAVESATRETLKRYGVNDGPDMQVKLKEALVNPEVVGAVKDAQTRAFAATQTLGQRLGRGVGTIALEGLGEGTGAYLGKLAADGEASKMEAIIEGISGLAVGGIQSAALSAMQSKETAKLVDMTQLQGKAEREVSQTAEMPPEAAVSDFDLEPVITEPIQTLTPEEEIAAQKQQIIMDSGTENILPDPEAVDDTVGLDEMMLDPLYKNPLEWETALQERMQKDMDAGISEVVARRRALEALPDIVPMTERPITWSSAPEQVGMSLKQAKLAPGSVAVVGGFNEQFSPAYTQALGSTIEQWAKKFLGKDEKVIINLSGLKGSAVGGYQQTPSGIHVISPRELVRTELSERFTGEGVTLEVAQPGQRGYNTFTQQQTFGGLTHEFGHAVAMANFNSAMPEQFMGIVGKLDSGKIYTERQLSEMPEAEAAVIRDYQQLKADILAEKVTAEELVEKWIGTWKLGRDLMKGQSRDLYSYANEVLLREAKLLNDPSLSSTPLNQISALRLIHAMGRETRTEQTTNAKGEPITRRVVPDAEEIAASNRRAEAYYLQFSEYMAEQFSRFAHQRDIGKGTALGTYFKRALETLRKFFQALKGRSGESGESIVKAGESFTNWIDQLHVSRALGEAEAKRRRANARRFKSRMEQGLKEVSKLTPARIVKKIVQAVKQQEEQAGEGNAVDDLEFLAEDTQAKEDLKGRIREALPNILDRDRQDLMRLVGQGRLMEAEDQLADIISERTKQDVDGGYEKTPDGDSVEEILKKIIPKKEASLWKKAVNFTADFGYKIVQLQQIAHESSDAGVRAFVNYQNQMLALKNNLLQKGTVVAEKWENLSRKGQEQLDILLMKELESGQHVTDLKQDQGTGKWQHVAGDNLRQFLQDNKIDPSSEEGQNLAALFVDLKNSILQHIQVTEAVAVEIIRDKYGKAPLVAKKKEVELRQMAQKWREAPYVPMGRYGNFVVKVFAKDSDGNRIMVYRTHFEDASSQDKMVKELKKKNLDVEYGKINEETSMQLSLPTEFLSVLSDSGEFNSDQLQKIGEMMMPLKADRAFAKFIRDADRIAGASTDRLRDYANWVEDSANFLSKLSYGRKMTKARAVTKHSMEQAQAMGEIETAREKQRVLDTMTKSQEFMMHPLEEWFKARSVVALSFLMWAPKTALMNLTGLFQTWAAVTADYGDINGNAIMAKSTKDLMIGKTTYDENWMLNKALEDGLIDQGFGYFMSGLANAGNLARRVRPTIAGKAARAFVDLGMWPFKAVEIANRKLTLLTVYRAEFAKLKKGGLSPEESMRSAYDTASRYTRLLQNDYASGNRPELMRGKKSLFMIFLSYPQYMLWIMSGGFERGTRLAATLKGSDPRSRFGGMTMRMWLVFLSLSGFEGLPFGEAVGDLLQKMWNLFGGTTNLRVEGQRFLKDAAGIEDSYWRNVIQRGFLHDVLGVDLSGSYSLGKPLPGLGLINPHSDNWREFVGEAFSELSGPFGGAVKAPLALGFDNELTGRDVGQALPGALGSVAKAVDAATNGIKSSKKERILKDAQGAYRDPTAAEIALIAGGFRLSEVAKFQNIEKLKREQIDYWMGRRTGLKQQYRTAREDRDPSLLADVQTEIDNFNKEIPDRKLRLSGKELNMFVRSSRRAINRLERDQYADKQKFISRDIDNLMR